MMMQAATRDEFAAGNLDIRAMLVDNKKSVIETEFARGNIDPNDYLPAVQRSITRDTSFALKFKY